MSIRRLPASAYQVAIPSYLRPRMLTERTLPMLTAGGVDPGRITVFVHSHDPHISDYHDTTRSAGVALHVTNADGINAQRAHIINHYPPGTPLVQTDDDLTGLVRAVDKKTLNPVTDVHSLLNDMFFDTAARDLHVWGLAPVPNAFYLTPGQLSEGLKFLIFTMVGCYTRPGHPVHTTTVPTKDDYELSLRAWWYDGAVLRNDHTAAKADIYKAPGGCQATRRPQHAELAVTELLRTWPGLVRRNHRRKSDYPEIILATRKRHRGHPATTPPPGWEPETT